MPAGDKAPSFDAYLQAMLNVDSWGSSLEIKALARQFDTKVILVPETLHLDPILFHKQGTKGTIVLWHTGTHFDCLQGELVGLQPRPYRGVDDVLRGGGDICPPSPNTVWTQPSCATAWTAPTAADDGTVLTRPSEVHSGAGGVRRRIYSKRLPFPGEFPAQSTDVQGSDLATTDQSDLTDMVEAEPELSKRDTYFKRGSRKRTAEGVLEWCCPMCPFVCRGASQDIVCKRRYDHIRYHHDGVGHPGRLSRPSNVVEANPGSGPFWQCPWCPYGISRKMRSSVSETIYFSERLLHRKAHHPKVPLQRWKALVRKGIGCTASGRAQRRITGLNVHAAKRKLKLPAELLAKVLPFAWPHVVKRRGVDALCVINMWMCRSCKCILPRPGKLKKHKCRPGLTVGLKACQDKRLKNSSAKPCEGAVYPTWHG